MSEKKGREQKEQRGGGRAGGGRGGRRLRSLEKKYFAKKKWFILTDVESFGEAIDFENVVAADDHHRAIRRRAWVINND